MDSLNSQIYFSIVVLGYKAGLSLVPFAEKLHGMMSQFNFGWEIILVGNYWPKENDATPDIVKNLSERLTNVRCVAVPKQGMAGWDMRMGMDMARGKYIGFIDGDGQIPLESIFDCLLKIESEPFDLVKTYRISRGDGIYRRMISWIFNKLFSFMFKIKVRDVNSNPKVLLRTQYEALNLQSDDWFYDAEIIIKAKKLGLRVGEVPMQFLALKDRPSFVNAGTLWEFLINMMRYKFFRPNTEKPSLLT